MKSIGRFVIALALVGSLVQPARAADVTVTRESDTVIKVKICPGEGETIKDFHFDRGSLANGAAPGPTVTDDQGLGWMINVKAGKVNVFGSSSVPSPDCATFTITLPAGVKFDKVTKGSIILTTDGDDDAQTGVHSTISGKVPKIVLSAAFDDDFDDYKTGSLLSGQGEWEVWYAGGADAPVLGENVNTKPNALVLQAASDLVQRFLITEGKWTFRAMTYLPSDSLPGVTGGYLIMMNRYGDPALDNWSLQIAFNDLSLGGTDPFLVHSQFDNAFAPIPLGQWVEFRAEIDLDADSVQNYYAGLPLGVPHAWSDNNFGSGPGLKEIANIDLWSPSGGLIIDDVSLTPVASCYPDCEGDGDLDVFDFLCFQGTFAENKPYADCEGDGDWDVFDFLCFQGAFANGC